MSNIHTLNDLNRRQNQNTTNNTVNQSQISIGFSGQAQNQQQQSNDNECQKCLKIFFPFFNVKTFCFIISVVNLVIYIIEEIVYNSQDKLRICTFYNMGGKHTPSIRYKYHIFRLITPVFLHASPWHLLSNTLTLYFFGFFTEHFLGTKNMIILYSFCGVFSTTFSALCLPDRISVGASGAIFSLLGFFIIYVIINRKVLMQNPNFKFMVVFFFAMLFFSFFFSIFQESQTEDVYGHLGTCKHKKRWLDFRLSSFVLLIQL
jgi:membrane associated rhomboid family serine protease